MLRSHAGLNPVRQVKLQGALEQGRLLTNSLQTISLKQGHSVSQMRSLQCNADSKATRHSMRTHTGRLGLSALPAKVKLLEWCCQPDVTQPLDAQACKSRCSWVHLEDELGPAARSPKPHSTSWQHTQERVTATVEVAALCRLGLKQVLR